MQINDPDNNPGNEPENGAIKDSFNAEERSASSENSLAGAGSTAKLVLFLCAAFGAFYVYILLSPNYTECLTENYCIESQAAPALLAGLRLLTLVIVLCAAFLSWNVCRFLLVRGLMVPAGGVLIFLLGVGGLVLFFQVTPSEDQGEFIHIAIIGGLIAGLGLFMTLRSFLRR